MTLELAVIFDVDGVLVDSYDAHLRSWLQVADEEGVRLTEADFVQTFGCTSREIVHRFWRIADEARIRAIDDRKEAFYRELVSACFPAMDGARELIDALHAEGIPLAMGSSGPPENVELALDRLDRRSAFSAVVTGRDVQRGKPDPEVFVKAAKRLNIPPDSCVVVEDAPPGVQAAYAAGMQCVVLLSKGRDAGQFATLNPMRMVKSLRELSPQHFRNIVNSRSD